MLTLAQKSVNAQLIMIMPGGGEVKGPGVATVILVWKGENGSCDT